MAKHSTQLIYIHIPKTGGSTLQGIINREYGLENVFNVMSNRHAQEYIDSIENKVIQVDIIKGHMVFGHHNSFPNPEKVSYFTMLRDPIKRIISNYYFILKQDNHRLNKTLKENNYSLKDYVESGVVANAENAQVRLLSDNIDAPHGGCTREMLEIAKRNIEERFAVTGINELFDASLLLMQEAYNWKTPFYTRKNVTGHGVKVEDLDKDTLAAIKKYNALDIELYEWAKERTQQQINDGQEDFAKKLATFKKKNKVVQKVANVKNKLFH
jgi:hypothetical protein